MIQFAAIAWLWAGLSSIVAWVALFLATTLGIRVLVIAIFAAVTLAFAAALSALVSGLITTTPSGLVQVLTFLPANLSVYLGCVVGAETAAAVYKYKLRYLELISSKS